MSIHALSWAFKKKVKSPSDKLVLLVLADFCDVRGHSSYYWSALCQTTGFSYSKIIKSLDKLESLGIISDTNKRFGFQDMFKVYFIEEVFYLDEDLDEVAK